MPAWVVEPILIVVEHRGKIAARLAALFTLVAAVALGQAAGKVWTPYSAHYRLQDQATAIVRTHAARSDRPGDTPALRAALLQAAREQGLEPHLRDGDLQIDANAFRIRLSCRYGIPVELLPGVRHTLQFHLHVDQPVLPRAETIFL